MTVIELANEFIKWKEELDGSGAMGKTEALFFARKISDLIKEIPLFDPKSNLSWETVKSLMLSLAYDIHGQNVSLKRAEACAYEVLELFEIGMSIKLNKTILGINEIESIIDDNIYIEGEIQLASIVGKMNAAKEIHSLLTARLKGATE